MPIFRVKSVKFTPAKKYLHGYTRGIRDKLEVWILYGLKIRRNILSMMGIMNSYFMGIITQTTEDRA